MSKEKKNKGSGSFSNARWFRRLWVGGSNALADELEDRKAGINDVEEIISPGRQVLRNFKERKLAVVALCFVAAMFLFVIFGPMFMKNYTDGYTEVTQKNVPPGLNMMSVPSELKNDIKMIDAYGPFSVGLSNAGKVYVWGQTKLGTTGQDVKVIPEEVQNAKIAMVAAGIDHIIAIGEDGTIYGWGNNRHGQFGVSQEMDDNPNIAMMPWELAESGVDVSSIKRLECGYQSTAILMEDGTLYLWGNRHAYSNMDSFLYGAQLTDVAFTLNYIVGLTEAGNSVFTGTRGLYNMYKSNVNDRAVAAMDYLDGRKIVGLEAASSNVCLMLDDGSICFTGDFNTAAVRAPSLPEGEYFTQIEAGSNHYTGLTNLGSVYSWGDDVWGQADAPAKASGAAQIFAGAFQSYTVDENGSLTAKWGLKGYIFGSDGYGADTFQRIVNGGLMTMTIGAVAVIISSIIGVIIGCLSGYFGGKVDMILMRIMEVFTAIPFLPFVLTLSSVMSQMTMSTNMRIFLIMIILGVLSWPGLARLVRGQVLLARESEYVVAAQAMGVKSKKIAFKHILPNIIAVILVTLTLDFATCMLTESTLSYLGFGVPYPQPSWGNMLYGANNSTIIKNFWWQWVFPAIFLGLTTICINIVGDTLRDVMDPKSSNDK